MKVNLSYLIFSRGQTLQRNNSISGIPIIHVYHWSMCYVNKGPGIKYFNGPFVHKLTKTYTMTHAIQKGSNTMGDNCITVLHAKISLSDPGTIFTFVF